MRSIAGEADNITPKIFTHSVIIFYDTTHRFLLASWANENNFVVHGALVCIYYTTENKNTRPRSLGCFRLQ